MANGNRVPTGIVELDALIDGGLRAGINRGHKVYH